MLKGFAILFLWVCRAEAGCGTPVANLATDTSNSIIAEAAKKTPAQLAACWAGAFGNPATMMAYVYNDADGLANSQTVTGFVNVPTQANAGINFFKLLCKCFSPKYGLIVGMYAVIGGSDRVPSDCNIVSVSALTGDGVGIVKYLELQAANTALFSANSNTRYLKKTTWTALGKASAKGDPHVTNIQGEKFDILKSGGRTMVQYPRESSDPSLVVTAQIVRADAKWCENTFIEKVEAQGSMLGSSVSFTMGKLRAPGPFKVKIGEKSMSLSEVIQKKVSLPAPGSSISGEAKQMTLTLAEGVSIQVQLVKHSHFQFFNLDVSGLSNLPGEVGGLLGMDDHSGEAHEDCKFKTHKPKMEEDDGLSDIASLITTA